MGKAFDVTAERRQVDYDPTVYDRRTYESEHEIVLKNARPKAVTVIVRETIGGKWEMLRKTHDFTKVAANCGALDAAQRRGGERVSGRGEHGERLGQGERCRLDRGVGPGLRFRHHAV